MQCAATEMKGEVAKKSLPKWSRQRFGRRQCRSTTGARPDLGFSPSRMIRARSICWRPSRVHSPFCLYLLRPSRDWKGWSASVPLDALRPRGSRVPTTSTRSCCFRNTPTVKFFPLVSFEFELFFFFFLRVTIRHFPIPFCFGVCGRSGTIRIPGTLSGAGKVIQSRSVCDDVVDASATTTRVSRECNERNTRPECKSGRAREGPGVVAK